MPGAWTTVDRLTDQDSPYAEEAVQSASYIMWLLSGRKFGGVFTTTETYCQNYEYGYITAGRLNIGTLPYHQAAPEIANGEIRNVCGDCGGCSHTVRLRGAPVVNVLSVVRGSSEIPLDQLVIVDRGRIAPADSHRCWGGCDDVVVTYQYGSFPPITGVHAATALADQYIWAATGDTRCTLPSRVTSISRQGVSWTLLDNQDFLDKGRTGIYAVDLFLTSVNPDRARNRPRVFTPDTLKAQTRRNASVPVTVPTRPPSAP
jgi:hypothetical protein